MNCDHSANTSTLEALYGLRGRVAFVTGAARGIGNAIATLFADLGAELAIVDRDEEQCQKAIENWKQRGYSVLGLCADVSRPADMDSAVASAWDHFGRIDVVVNNAGVGLTETIENTTLDDWHRILGVNLDAVFYTSKVIASRLIDAGQEGRIINVASMSGLIINHPQPQAAYNTSKAAVIHLTKSCASEWAPHGIQVNSISPGYTLTELTSQPAVACLHDDWRKGIPMNRLAHTDEIAAATAFLASKASSYITGHNLVVDGGFTVW